MEFGGITDVEKMTYSAQSALVFYSLDREDKESNIWSYKMGGGSRTPESFVTLHRIQKGLVCEGQPVSRKKLLKICRTVIPSLDRDFDYLPEDVIAYSKATDRMVWWLPAGVRSIFFNKATGIKSGKAPLPPLLFSFSRGNLQVFALSEDSRPVPSTITYYSPFFNGSCMGNVSLPMKALLSDLRKIEELFFGAAFTLERTPTLNGITGEDLWKSLISGELKQFPVDRLVKNGTVSKLLSGRGHED